MVLALALAGCGGGGGNDSIKPEPDLGPIGGGSGTPGDGTPGSTNALNINSSTLLDTSGNTISAVGINGAYYQVTVTDATGAPVPNAKVSFAIDATGVSLTQSTSGSVLTDSDGQARVFLKPDSPAVSGAYTVTATATFNGNTATSSKTFSVQATNVSVVDLRADNSALESGAQTSVSLKVTDNTGAALNGVLVNLDASCGQLPAQMVSDTNGMVEVVYKAINENNTLCSGPVTLTASAGNSTQTTNINVAAPQATSIVYTSSELTLGIANSGSSSSGTVEFTVYSNTAPLANAEVILSLEKSPLGLSFGQLGSTADVIRKTDANGNISVNIYPGSTPGPVEIKASLASDTRINALSKGISIASSRVTQDGLSISQERNVLDWSMDGDSTDIVVRMVDRNGNAVPDNTVVNLTAEGGKVSPAQCLTDNGQCTVSFSTQNPRPGDGRVSILAVAEGEKAYIDNNRNNAWDRGIDTLVHNIGDTFRDDNENNIFDSGEFIYPLTTQATGVCENNLDQFIQLKFPTASVSKKDTYKQSYINSFVNPNIDNTCNSDLDAVVRYQSIQLLSDGSSARFTLVNSIGLPLGLQAVRASDTFVNVRINSGGFYDLNPMPSGTTIAATVTDKTDGPTSGSCKVEMISGYSKVPALVNTGSLGQNLGTITGYALTECEAGDYFKVTVNTPKGNNFTRTYIIQ
ncbi:Ig-like domain-containing protein [Psychrobacter aestuarii]|uniref:Ig-like domain-containing protein n=1 Tax=Psychrobacter aestuarii TaxID=556327 RepID=A0ABP3FJG7_9GAMM|nr:Ig-like domain-containing protein [Psychrobacter aestuarii]